MNYRINPKTGQKHSLLGFGAMRLPGPAGSHTGIDEDESIRMIRHAIDCGVNYIDTAYTYYDGASETVVAKALKDGYGEKAMVATKFPTMMLQEAREHDLFFETSLKRLERDSIDFYLLHGMKERYWPVIQKLETVSFLERKKQEGAIKNFGFSYHGESFELFKEILDSAPWDFVQIQLNYMDAEIQAGVKGLKYAASKGLPVIIMEPLKGGKLTDRLVPSIQQYWDSIEKKRSPADWGLRWVANFPEVTTILSGMSTMEQLEENIITLSDAGSDCLDENELAVIEKVAGEFRRLIPYACTGCAYCRSGCPMQIDIPLVISMRNEASMFDCNDKIKYEINRLIRKPPSLCIACGKCEDVCPQHLHVIDILKEIKEMFEEPGDQWWREYVKEN
jgi:predicted aldo/keto reductase-like oxidoreductase